MRGKLAYHEATKVVYGAQSLRSSDEDPVQRVDGDDGSVLVSLACGTKALALKTLEAFAAF